ncbi:MAG: PEP/pyruvate-binding domain-containing protein [Anaerolineae bacterium]
MSGSLLLELNGRGRDEGIGNKAQGLRRLIALKARVPATWVVPWEGHARYLAGDAQLESELSALLAATVDPDRAYAVRSSTNCEDSGHASFAGLFCTVLGAQGIPGLLAAIHNVWESARSPMVDAYLSRRNLGGDDLRMAVIVQEMVAPAYSGVLFSQNPMTGLHEIVIEAVEGEGTALVQDGCTPDRWVYRGGGWVAQPDEKAVPVATVEAVLASAQPLLKRLKRPADLEWVYDGRDVFWVQLRDITGLVDVKVYSNRLSKDMMPGMIHPLIWSINVPMINGVWIGLLEEIIGKLPLEPEDLARAFYYRGYFDMGAIGKVFSVLGFPSEGLEMMMGVVPREGGRPVFHPSPKALRHLPRLAAFIADKWRFERRLVPDLASIRAELHTFALDPPPDAGAADLAAEITRLRAVVKRAVYLNVLAPLLGTMYHRLLEQQLQRLGVDATQFDLTAGVPGLADLNPNTALAELHAHYLALGPTDREALEAAAATNGGGNGDVAALRADMAHFLARFGHLSDNSNNFMAAPWREQPGLVLRLVREYDPAQRKGGEPLDVSRLEAGPVRRSVIRFWLARTRRFALYREQVSAAYVYGYGLFRPYMLALARRLTDRGWLAAAQDIFLLRWEEIERAVSSGDGHDLAGLAGQRAEEMARLTGVELPDVIYGEEPPPILPQHLTRLHGTPTSQGYAVGPVVSVHGIADLPRVSPGDVLVVPYSDVGWTPLFARAAAVIAESGGILSHSSIIAREYGIPAVVSVSSAMRLRDGQRVSVNGYTGEIVLLDAVQVAESEEVHAGSKG